jgi:hypothetical protein
MPAHTPTIARSVADRAVVFMISSLEGYFRQVQEVLEQQGIPPADAVCARATLLAGIWW